MIIDAGGGSRGGGSGFDDSTQLTLPFGIEEWRDAIYARIVKKVGERRYWETWAKDVAKIAEQHIARITGLLADPESNAAKEFEAFLAGLRGNLNDGITQTDAVEMLAQHLITRPVFEALFAGYDFAANNPVAQTMERMLAVLDEHSLDAENSELEKFYSSVRGRVEGVDNAEGRQRIIVELYDKFFATAFKRTVDKLGIVYTPVEIVDFILNSADEVLRKHFGQGLTDEGVHILDGFTGTGTFMVRLLQSGLIKPHDLARKYANELHANEILLLAYYIAAVNIETTYQDLVRGSLDEEAAYEPFPGLVLTDTFQSYEHGDEDDLGVFPENNERINRQRKLPITVIVGNPPYSVGAGQRQRQQRQREVPDARRRYQGHLRGPVHGDAQELALRLLHPRHQVGLAAHQGARCPRLRDEWRLARLQHRRRHAPVVWLKSSATSTSSTFAEISAPPANSRSKGGRTRSSALAPARRSQ